MKLSEIVPPGGIVVGLKASERGEAVGEILDALVSAGLVEADLRKALLESVLERERRGSTGFGKGVAVPHVKHDRIGRLIVGIGVSEHGVDFSALDKQPVYAVFLLLSPSGSPEDHLRAMEVIFKNLSQPKFRALLRRAATVDDVRSLLEDADNQRLTG